MSNVTCNKCGTVAFEVSREYAETEVHSFNVYFNKLLKQDQDDYYGGKTSRVANYEQCWCGNSYKDFRPSKPGDCPDGCTLSPIIRSTD